MSERPNIWEVVFDGYEYDEGWPTSDSPTSLNAVIEWFDGARSVIPAEFRASAVCEIDSEGGYEGERSAHMVIKYRRPMTDEEWATFLAKSGTPQ